MLPWSKEPIGREVNLAFTLVNNQVRLLNVRLNEAQGEFVLGTAQPRSVVDVGLASRAVAPATGFLLHLGSKETVQISPAVLDLGRSSDGILGSDAFSKHAITIDYAAGLVTYQKEGIHPEMMTLYRFAGAPSVDVTINGESQRAIVDTASPDTLTLPGPRGRQRVQVTIAGIDFGLVDVAFADVAQPHLGNRLLAHFLVTVDYGKGVVGLFRDPRVPMQPVVRESQLAAPRAAP